MSYKVEYKGLPHLKLAGNSTKDKDAYGLLKKTEKQTAHMHTSIPNSKFSGVKTIFGNGVRVPVLKDIENKYYGRDAPTSCRFDIVEKVKTVIKPEISESLEIPSAHSLSDSTMAKVEQAFMVPRHPTFHYTNQKQFETKERNVLERMSPYHWNKYVKSGKEGDARDVLYKNTYCLDPDKVRFRSSTLPRIAPERPLSVKSSDSIGKRTSSRASNASSNPKEITIIPQQPRGTIVRFREYMKPVTYSSDKEVLEVKRVSSVHRQVLVDPVAHLRHMLPLIRQDSKKSTRVERPLKFENSRYRDRGYRNTLFTKQIHHTALDKNFYSADTFKEYLETLQMNATKMPTKQGREGQDTASSRKRSSQHYDVNTHALQSVGEVNKPDGGALNAPPVTEEHSVTQDNRSAITIEIKPSWEQNERDTGSDMLKISSRKSELMEDKANQEASAPKPVVQKAQSGVSDPNNTVAAKAGSIKEGTVIKIPSSHGSDSGTTCPTNTPTPNINLESEVG